MSQLSDLLSPATQAVLVAAQEMANQRHEKLASAHVTQALFDISETPAHDLLRNAGVNDLRLPVGSIQSNEEEIPQLIEQAVQIARNFRFGIVEPEHLLLAITQQSAGSGHQLLQQTGLDISSVAGRTMEWLFGLSLLRNVKLPPNATSNLKTQPPGPLVTAAPTDSGWAGNSLLEQCGRDLTALAAENLDDPLIGRDLELAAVIRTLLRRTKNNPLLIGDPGVGKTALAHGLAARLVSGEVPGRLQGKRLIELSTAGLIAGTMYRGQFEERVRQLLAEVAEAGDIILFIDEIHTLSGTGGAEGSLDLANMLKPALAAGELSLIGATTYEEYSRHFAHDRALERRFQPIFLDEPSLKESERILRGLLPNLAEHHYVTIAPGTAAAAVNLADRFIRDRALPDKALDLLDEACAAAAATAPAPAAAVSLKTELDQVIAAKTQLTEEGKLKEALNLRHREQRLMNKLLSLPPTDRRPVVDEAAIVRLISERTGLAPEHVSQTPPDAANLLKALRRQIIGQDGVLREISDQLARAQAGLRAAEQPLASFVFLGPTGVGKTETARVLARELFGSDRALIKIDMSELTEKHAIAQLIGSPKGYVGHDDGGVLTDKLRRQPASVVLFDEIEKAHPDIFNLLLQILEDGVVTDTHGRTASFNQAVVILTSNLGTEAFDQKGLGFAPSEPVIDDELQRALADFLRPELLARLSAILTFQPFTRPSVVRLARRRLALLRPVLTRAGRPLTITPRALDWLVDRYDAGKGARSIDELVRRYVERPAVELLRQPTTGRIALVVNDRDELDWRF